MIAVAAGALTTAPQAFAPRASLGAVATYPYYNDCWAYQPLYDAYGAYLGQQYVNICVP